MAPPAVARLRRVTQILLLQERSFLLLQLAALHHHLNQFQVNPDPPFNPPDPFNPHLSAQSDGGVGEGPPLSFEGLPLATQLRPVQLQTLPLFQEVAVGQLGGRRGSQAVLRDPTTGAGATSGRATLGGGNVVAPAGAAAVT